MDIRIGIVVSTLGEDTEKACIDSVTNLVSNVVIIRNVTQFSVAMNLGISICDCDYVMHVASDMILHENAIRIVDEAIKKNSPALMVFPLNDWLLGEMLGLAVFNKRIFEELGGYKLSLVDMELEYIERLEKNGGVYQLCNTIIADHVSRKDPKALFWQMARGGSKVWARLDWWSSFNTPYRIIKKIKDYTLLSIVALFGHIFGIIFAPIISKPLSSKVTQQPSVIFIKEGREYIEKLT